MNLILQAIQALFRKVENSISVNVAKLTKKINTAQNTANMASKKATAAQTAANEAQTTADDAQNAANATIPLTSTKITGTLPVSKGGSGATTASAARLNLGIGGVLTASLGFSSGTLSYSKPSFDVTDGALIIVVNPTDKTYTSILKLKIGNVSRQIISSKGTTVTELPKGSYLVFLENGIATFLNLD